MIFQRSQRQPLRSRLIRMQLLLVSLVLMGSTAAFIANDLYIFKKSVSRSLKSTAKILEANLISALAFNDKAEVSRTLHSLETEPAIRLAYVFDPQGQVIGKYGDESWGTPQFDGQLSQESITLRGSHLLYFYSLGRESEKIGFLYLDADLMVFATEYKSYLFIVLFVFFSGLMISLFLVRIAQESISAPITDLADAARRVSTSGDYSLRISGKALQNNIEEVVTLSTEFNQMLDQIEIKDHKVRLEKEVAEKANLSKSLFLANISHELRTPMHGILSFARFGQQKIETATKEKLKSYFDEISMSGTQLMSLLNDLLDLSKLESGKVDYRFQINDFSEVAKSVQAEMRAFAEEKGLTILIKGPNEPVEATFDMDRIRQVLRNVISNAVKFSFKNTAIQLIIDQTSSHVRCTVVNQGVGIPPSELETIFDKFIQSSKTRTGAGGTGLGLAICREIVLQHQGKMWALSELGKETRFIFEFPKTEPLPAPAEGLS